MANQSSPAAAADLKLCRRLAREYARAIRAEEDAPTIKAAYRLATASERCLRRLQAAQAGLPLPEPRFIPSARNLGLSGFAALAMLGRTIARGVARAASLAKAQAASAAKRIARAAARAARMALRRALQLVAVAVLALVPATTRVAVVAPKGPVAMFASSAAAWLRTWGSRFAARLALAEVLS